MSFDVVLIAFRSEIIDIARTQSSINLIRMFKTVDISRVKSKYFFNCLLSFALILNDHKKLLIFSSAG